MEKLEILKNAEITVKRLILQYKEYTNIHNNITEKETEKLKVISQLSKQESKTIPQIMLEQDKHEELISSNKKIELLKLDLQQISDEMTFPNPIVWMMYKFRAYKRKANEISTLRQFRNHCTPDGYICTERYKFLRDYLDKNYHEDLNNISVFSDALELNQLYKSDLIINLCKDLDFITIWKENEYLKTEGKVNKWKTVIKSL